MLIKCIFLRTVGEKLWHVVSVIILLHSQHEYVKEPPAIALSRRKISKSMDRFVAFGGYHTEISVHILILIYNNLLTNTYIWVPTEGTYHRMSSSQK